MMMKQRQLLVAAHRLHLSLETELKLEHMMHEMTFEI